MERLVIVVSLVMTTVSFQSNAAALNWVVSDNVLDNGVIEAIADQALVGDYQNNLSKGSIADKWVFKKNDLTGVVVKVQEVKNSPFDIMVAMDNVLVCFNNSCDWSHNGKLAIDKHTIGMNSINGKLDVLTLKIPAAAWLFGSALIGLLILTYHRKSLIFD